LTIVEALVKLLSSLLAYDYIDSDQIMKIQTTSEQDFFQYGLDLLEMPNKTVADVATLEKQATFILSTYLSHPTRFLPYFSQRFQEKEAENQASSD
jgi:hypothetical protein